MRRQFSLALAAVVLLSGTAPIRGQDVKDTLGLIPQDVLGFVLVTRLDQVNDKVMAVAKKMGLPIAASPLDMAKGFSKGLNSKGSAAVVLLPEDGPPVPLILLPVSDYQEFIGQFNAKGTGIVDITLVNKKMAVAGKGKHALLVESEHKGTLKAVLAGKSNLTKWAQPVKEWLEVNDVTFVATQLGIKQVGTVTRDRIAMVKDLAGGMDEFGFMKAYIEGLETFLKTSETEVTHAAVGTRIDQAGNLIVDVRGMFAKGGSLARSAAGIKTIPGGPLANLPSGPYAMAFGGSLPPSVMQALSRLSLQLMKVGAKQQGAELTDDKLQLLEKSYDSMHRGMVGMNYVFRTGKGKDGLLGGLVATVTTDDSASYLENYQKMIPQTNAIFKELNQPSLPTTKLTKKTVGKLSILESTADLSAPNDPFQKKMMEVMYGSDGKFTFAQTALDSKTVLTAFTSAEGLSATLQAAKKRTLKDDAEVARTLGLLPPNPQWVVLLDPRGLTSMASQVVDALGAGVQVPEFAQTPPVGMGLKISESGLILQIVIPAQVLEGIGQLLPGRGA